MSHWWRDKWVVILYPDRLILVRRGRGFRQRNVEKTVTAVASVGRPAWQGVLGLLNDTINNQCRPHANVTVILSNHFVRYLVIPWDDAITDEAEMSNLARHSFRKTYGERSDVWTIRSQRDCWGISRLAVAVDTALLDGITRCFEETAATLKSIQPYVMVVINQWRKQLVEQAAWCVMVENGKACLALLVGKQWRSLRVLQIGNNLTDEIALLLAREAQLIEGYGNVSTVYLHAAYDASIVLSEDRWNVRRLVLPHSASTFGGDHEIDIAMSV